MTESLYYHNTKPSSIIGLTSDDIIARKICSRIYEYKEKISDQNLVKQHIESYIRELENEKIQKKMVDEIYKCHNLDFNYILK